MRLTTLEPGRTLRAMAKQRIAPFLALAFLFVSPLCDAGSGCAVAAGVGGAYWKAVPAEGAAAGGMSGPALRPGGSEPAATIGKGERLQAADLAGSEARFAGGFSPATGAPAAAAPNAAPTPLYLSHCAFLC